MDDRYSVAQVPVNSAFAIHARTTPAKLDVGPLCRRFADVPLTQISSI